MERLLNYNPVLLVLFVTLFKWGITALGTSMVFFFKAINKKMLNGMLGFAVGAMILAVVEELIPEFQTGNETHMSTMGALAGFATMMVLDVALG